MELLFPEDSDIHRTTPWAGPDRGCRVTLCDVAWGAFSQDPLEFHLALTHGAQWSGSLGDHVGGTELPPATWGFLGGCTWSRVAQPKQGRQDRETRTQEDEGPFSLHMGHHLPGPFRQLSASERLDRQAGPNTVPWRTQPRASPAPAWPGLATAA